MCDLVEALDSDRDSPVIPGLIYHGALTIQGADLWPPELRKWQSGRWYLQIGRSEYLSDDLEELERVLYEWAKDEGILGECREEVIT